jgi:hypothetical protein
MPSFLHEKQSTEVNHRKDPRREDHASSVRITVIVLNRSPYDAPHARGRQIKEKARVPRDFALYRRAQGGNETIADDAEVELHKGDHFFARPSSNAS